MITKKKFHGVLEPDNTNLKWTIVKLPFDPIKTWPKRSRLRVRGTINGYAFRTSLFISALAGYYLPVNKDMQKGAGVALGSMAEVVLEPDLEERVTTVPPELAKLLRQHSPLRKWYEQLSPSAHANIARTISEPKSPESRLRRAEQMAERLMLAMEGERELPPILQMEFARRPQARAAWNALTPVQRRGHLLGIFYYQTPEAREKRARKAIEEALKAIQGRSASQ